MVSEFGKSGNIGREWIATPIFSTLFAVLLTSGWPPHAAADEPTGPDFNRRVRPLISDRCLSCHGPDAHHREADLRLDDRKSATMDRGGYAVIRAGDVDHSEMIARITSDDPDVVMPPPEYGKPLSSEEIRLLQDWVAAGAEYQPHWAYVPPRSTSAPAAARADHMADRIDAHIDERLRQEGLQRSPQADPATLVRRLSFDLTGLPPDPADVAAFVASPTDAAWETLIDRYLATDAYAERMTAYWLDLVRFADTVGYHGDQDHSISPYRDWVIDAFADNMPFDQFTAEQLAGDLLPNASVDQKIASGYNRLLQTTHEGGLQKKEYLAIYQADRVRNVSAVWMGATVGCAQCHDHKYDPYTAKDFYAMAAFFADIDEEQHFSRGTNSLPTSRPPELTVHSRRERRQLKSLERQLEDIEDRLQQSPSDTELTARKKRLTQQRDDLLRASRKTMISASLKQPRTVRLLPRGDWLDESGPIIAPAVPEFLGSIAKSSRPTRLDLARWLTDTKTGSGQLTARVFANRFWFLLMGRGIAADLEDFGGQGTPPEHPQLLDDLAMEFVDSNWDMQHVLKAIASSQTYRQSSAWTPELLQSDPENLLLARQSAFRLPAEMVRDSALKISGLLVNKVGGASVKPYQPAGYYRHLNFPTRKYAHHTDDRQWRRGLYVHWQRQFLHPMMKAFDGPSREECTAERPVSNTPLAALTLLNDPTFVEASRAFAERILTENADANTSARLDFATQLALSRQPDTTERQLLTELLDTARREYAASPQAASEAISVGQAKRKADIDSAEMAAWTTVARTILNLD
ncbi:MAG: PSD1 and planctomycete cytochrome C domain-containing protein, partial [Planctomycetaceae bacterium]|nr:PSD1 and planctomycete cytochrome C domain-containing protein [Planctomycetaceae bacterium]